jgi:hypothetical protein
MGDSNYLLLDFLKNREEKRGGGGKKKYQIFEK